MFKATKFWNDHEDKIFNKNDPFDTGFIILGNSLNSDLSTSLGFVKPQLKNFSFPHKNLEILINGDLTKTRGEQKTTSALSHNGDPHVPHPPMKKKSQMNMNIIYVTSRVMHPLPWIYQLIWYWISESHSIFAEYVYMSTTIIHKETHSAPEFTTILYQYSLKANPLKFIQ